MHKTLILFYLFSLFITKDFPDKLQYTHHSQSFLLFQKVYPEYHAAVQK